MTKTSKEAAAPLDLLPEEMREPAISFLIEQAEKFRALKEAVAEGLADVQAGRVSQWDFQAFFKR